MRRLGLGLSLGSGRASGGAPSFSPADIASLRMWLDPSDAGNRTIGAGPTVTALTDKSGNGNHANGGTSPGFGTLNGLGCIDNSGSQYLVLPNFSSFTAAEIFVVCAANNNTGDNNGLWLLSGGGAAYHSFNDGKTYESFGSTGYQISNFTGGNQATPHVWNVISTASEWTANRAGAELYTTGSNTVAFHTFGWLGSNWSALFFQGRIGEVVMCNAKVTPTERTNMNAYLTTKWGL